MISSEVNRARMAGFFVGATLFWLMAFFLHKAGYLYVYMYDHQAEFRIFNQSLTDTIKDVQSFDDALVAAKNEMENALAQKRIPAAHIGFAKLEEILPDFYNRKIKALAERTKAVFIVTWQNGNYKILVDSELCPAFAISRPYYVDQRRKRYPVFCRLFGVWNRGGEVL